MWFIFISCHKKKPLIPQLPTRVPLCVSVEQLIIANIRNYPIGLSHPRDTHSVCT